MKSKISAFYLEKKSFVPKKICRMLLIKTLKSKISDFLYSNTCFCLRLYSTLQDSSLDTSCLYYNNSMPIFAPSTPNLIFCLINRTYFIRSVLRQRRTFFTLGCFHNFERSKDVSIYIYVVYELCIANMYCGKF